MCVHVCYAYTQCFVVYNEDKNRVILWHTFLFFKHNTTIWNFSMLIHRDIILYYGCIVFHSMVQTLYIMNNFSINFYLCCYQIFLIDPVNTIHTRLLWEINSKK